MKKSFAIFLCLIMTVAFCLSGCGNSKDNTEESTIDKTAPHEFILTPDYADGIINNNVIDDNATATMWNAKTKAFEECELNEENIVGNFTKVNKKGTKVQIVPYEDKSSYWDEDVSWIDGAGTDAEPALSDELGRECYEDAEYRVPMGERILAGFKLGDYSGTTDFSNVENSEYWADIDFYNATSSDSLTMLTGYKTELQTTSWTCGLASINTVLEWYGVRDGLNEMDLAALRGSNMERGFARGTEIEEIENVFDNLTSLGITGEWEIMSSEQEKYAGKLYKSNWVQKQLKEGHPIIVGSNSYGWHYQVIIGYDNMGTETPLDDVLIMMDPYDTTDHNNNGYTVQSYLRLAYSLYTSPYTGIASAKFIVAYPSKGWEYEATMGEGISDDLSNVANFTDEYKIPYGSAAEDIQKYYPDTEDIGDNGLAGPASSTYARKGDYDNSPYYKFIDFYNSEGSDTMKMLTYFQTLQQSTEWTCGLASAEMVMNWYDKLEGETDVRLSTIRQDGEAGPTYVSGMEDVFAYMNKTYNQDWIWFTNSDLDDPQGEESYIGDYCLQAGTSEDWYGLIPYLLEKGIPIMIGWDEWGGHWQVIVGYDDMGTPEKTQDDVLVLADPYDTTDHNQDGYVIESFERLVYGWYSSFDENSLHNSFVVAFPESRYQDVIKELGLDK